MFDSLRHLLRRGDAPELVAEGHIVALQTPAPNGNGMPRIEFTLDTQADLTFHQDVNALSAGHKRGESVRVHYEASRDNPHVAVVRWVEARTE